MKKGTTMSRSISFSRRSALLGMGALGVAGLTGCAAGAKPGKGDAASDGGGESETQSFGSGSQTLTILSISGSLPEEDLNTFSEENDCTISLQEYAFDKLTAMLAAGNPPDIVRGLGGVDTPYLQWKGIAEPLGSLMEFSEFLSADRLDEVNNLWRHDGTKQGQGQTWGIAKDYSYDLQMWINAELTGIDPSLEKPLTYAELIEAAKKTTKSSGGRVETYGYGCYLTPPDIQAVQGMMATADAVLFSEDFKTLDLTQDAAVEALDFYRQMWESRATPSPLAPNSNSLYDMFKAGRVDTFQSGYWTQGMMTDATDEEASKLYMIPTPILGDKRFAPVLSATGYWIPKQAKNKELGWKFLEYHLGGASAEARGSDGWGVPIVKEHQELMPTESEMNKRALDGWASDAEHFGVLSFTPYAKVDALNLDLTKALEDGVRAKKKTSEIAADATELLNAQLKRGDR